MKAANPCTMPTTSSARKRGLFNVMWWKPMPEAAVRYSHLASVGIPCILGSQAEMASEPRRAPIWQWPCCIWLRLRNFLSRYAIAATSFCFRSDQDGYLTRRRSNWASL